MSKSKKIVKDCVIHISGVTDINLLEITSSMKVEDFLSEYSNFLNKLSTAKEEAESLGYFDVKIELDVDYDTYGDSVDEICFVLTGSRYETDDEYERRLERNRKARENRRKKAKQP